jgi:hypothetical protein
MKSSVAIIFICTSFDDARTALLATITPLKTATQQRFVLSSVGGHFCPPPLILTLI